MLQNSLNGRKLVLGAVLWVCCWVFLKTGITRSAAQPTASASGIIIDYPANRSLFPPDIIAPLFQWRDASNEAHIWRIEIVFADRSSKLQLWSKGEKFQIGEIDEKIVGYVPPAMTVEQRSAHTWRPDAQTWERIKKHSVKQAATVVVEGFQSESDKTAVSQGEVRLQTSTDPVGAPVLFRDVPLIPAPVDERGIIKPLPDFAIPQIKWQLRYISEPRGKVLMEGLPTCANCHSVSSDGKNLGLDVDGPANDKGLYAMIPLRKVSSISNEYVIHWADFSDPDITAQKRFGAMSQISPDGKSVITSVDVPGSHGKRAVDRMYVRVYPHFGYLQVFYPTRGVLAWYERDTHEFHTLPGADDPEYVHVGAFWSPDGKNLIFSRARAKDPYSAGQPPAKYANDPNETQIQYDLYRIPFNDGKGGKAERVVGASENGMSNNFPKVSPDGKWIVFVQNKNAFLMRPDSQLYMVPFQGGTARRLNCNFTMMNSWHTFSPNGRWLAFSSKYPNYYTKLYLTHIDENGNDSPAILVENATAANRAVNIPEFVNIPPGGLEHIDTPALEFYRVFDGAVRLSVEKKFDNAIAEWKRAVELAPDDARAHGNLAIALMEQGRVDEAIPEFRKSIELNANSSQMHNNLGTALQQKGNTAESLALFDRAVELNPDNALAQINLGNALLLTPGGLSQALAHFEKAVELQPDSAKGQNDFGVALARAQRLEEATEHLRLAISLAATSADYHYNLGRVLAARNDFAAAQPEFEAAVSLSNAQQPAFMQMLAAMYSENGRYAEAVSTARKALALTERLQNQALAAVMRENLSRYEAQAHAAGFPSDGSR